MPATIDIVAAARVAAAHRVTEARVLRAADDAGVNVHRINGRAFIDVADEDRIGQQVRQEQEGK